MVNYVKYKKILKIVGMVFVSPFAMIIINSFIMTVFHLGIYLGTAIRYLLHNIIC